MKTFSRSTLGVAAAIILMNAAATLNAQTEPATSSTATSSSAKDALAPNIQPTSPLAQVVRLVQAGIDENIIQSYITNSPSTFNLDSDKIIYLTDVGAPSTLVTAMMQRDQVLQQQIAASQTATAPAPLPTSAPDSTATYATDDPAAGAPAPDVAIQSPPPDVNVNYFYDTLTPYGSWVNVDGYGACWRPTVGLYDHGWQPYGNRGRWVNTDCGWYWQSDYAWGTTFHYGRWFRDPGLGWCWWPDTVWAPSWVTWRYTDDYCGWAPLPPFTVYRPGLGFLYRGNGISVGFDFGLAINDFIFVSGGHFCDPHPRRFACPPTEIGRVYESSIVINNLNTRDHDGHHFVFNGGVPPVHFANSGGAPIRTVPIHELQNPYNGRPAYNPNRQANNGNQYQTGVNNNNYHGQYAGQPNLSPNQGQANTGWHAGQPNPARQYSPNNNYNNRQQNTAPAYSQPNQQYQFNRGNQAPAFVGQQHQPVYAEARENSTPLPTHAFNAPPTPVPQPSYNPAPAPSHSAPPAVQHSSPPASGGGRSNDDRHR